MGHANEAKSKLKVIKKKTLRLNQNVTQLYILASKYSKLLYQAKKRVFHQRKLSQFEHLVMQHGRS